MFYFTITFLKNILLTIIYGWKFGHIYVKLLRWKVEGLCPKGKLRQDFKIVHVSRVPCF